MNIHLGYTVGSGEPVAIPLKHLAVTGQTQESGKTTTLEALAERSALPVLAFITKRGEGSFAGGRRLQPYFRDRADWQFVDQLLEAQLREKNKFLRPWIIRICRTTRTLADVHAAVKAALAKSKGINEGVYTQLDAYLNLIVPAIARVRLATGIELSPGLNVMDVSSYATPMQMLFVQSAIDWVNERERGVVTVVPEAWEFVPEGRGSPVKPSAVSLVRKGAGLGNFIWVDSQDMAGVDKTILRGCTVWLIGAQREANEIKRNLANIPAGIERPKPAQIAQLGRGQFFACWKECTVQVYVQPSWMNEDVARAIARGEIPIDAAVARRLPAALATPTEDTMSQAIEERLDRLLTVLEQRESTPASSPHPATAAAVATSGGDEEALFQRLKTRLLAEARKDATILKVIAQRAELDVAVEKVTIQVDGNTLRGRLARMIAEGWFAELKTGNATFEELRRKGFATAKPNVYRELDKLAADEFLTKEQGGFLNAPGAKVRIIDKRS